MNCPIEILGLTDPCSTCEDRFMVLARRRHQSFSKDAFKQGFLYLANPGSILDTGKVGRGVTHAKAEAQVHNVDMTYRIMNVTIPLDNHCLA